MTRLLSVVINAFILAAAGALMFALAFLALENGKLTRAVAQDALDCRPEVGTIDNAAQTAYELGVPFHVLTPEQVDRYIATAIDGRRPAGSEGMRGIVSSMEAGAIFALTRGGIICKPFLRLTPATHERALRAALGSPA